MRENELVAIFDVKRKRDSSVVCAFVCVSGLFVCVWFLVSGNCGFECVSKYK